MAIIFLMRHAKAERARPGTKDFDRPLAASGKEDAQEMGRLLLLRFGMPDRVLCSGARRTRQTLEAMALDLPEASVSFSDALFDADGKGYIAALQREAAGSVLMIGHNPAVHDAASMLAGDGNGIAQGVLASAFPTAGIAVLDGPEQIAELAAGNCFLRDFLVPTPPSAA